MFLKPLFRKLERLAAVWWRYAKTKLALFLWTHCTIQSRKLYFIYKYVFLWLNTLIFEEQRIRRKTFLFKKRFRSRSGRPTSRALRSVVCGKAKEALYMSLTNYVCHEGGVLYVAFCDGKCCTGRRKCKWTSPSLQPLQPLLWPDVTIRHSPKPTIVNEL